MPDVCDEDRGGDREGGVLFLVEAPVADKGLFDNLVPFLAFWSGRFLFLRVARIDPDAGGV